ncbi:MAG: transketolase C-terminal domain-containing protein, partial [Candidatus Thiodiazotropha taylori]
VSLVLSDQSLGQSQAIIEASEEVDLPLKRSVTDNPGEDYRRYQIVAENISPMSLPGTPDGMYTADGLEHNDRGTPSSMASDHREQLNKRLQKLKQFDYGEYWAEVSGQGDTCLITWGSSTGAVKEAADQLNQAGNQIRVIALRLLAPLQRDKILELVDGATKVLVVEQNHGGQLFHYLQSESVLPLTAQSLAQPGPLPIRPGRIMRAYHALD